MNYVCNLAIPWSTFWILTGLVLAILAVVWLHIRKGNDFNIIDLVTDGEPAKASLNKLIILGSFLLAVWLIVMRTLDAADEIPESVDTLLLGVLGIFVVGRVVGQGIYTAGNTATRKAAINRGRTEDEEDIYLGADRRVRTNDLDDERPPGLSKRSAFK